MGYFKSKPWCICCKNKKKISTCFIGQLKFRFCWTVKWWRNQDIKKNLINSKNLKSNKSVQNKYFRDCFIAHFQFHFFFSEESETRFFVEPLYQFQVFLIKYLLKEKQTLVKGSPLYRDNCNLRSGYWTSHKGCPAGLPNFIILYNHSKVYIFLKCIYKLHIFASEIRRCKVTRTMYYVMLDVVLVRLFKKSR